jgi:hypothetical protein
LKTKMVVDGEQTTEISDELWRRGMAWLTRFWTPLDAELLLEHLKGLALLLDHSLELEVAQNDVDQRSSGDRLRRDMESKER